jgi:iron(III) transport system ATP-binding protein
VWLDLPDGLIVSARLDGAQLPVEGQDVSVSVLGAALRFPSDATGAVASRSA